MDVNIGSYMMAAQIEQTYGADFGADFGFPRDIVLNNIQQSVALYWVITFQFLRLIEQPLQKCPLTKRSRVGKPPHVQVHPLGTGTALDVLGVEGVAHR